MHSLRRHRRSARAPALLTFLGLALLLHFVVLGVLAVFWDRLTTSATHGRAVPVTLVLEVPEPPPAPEPEEPELDMDGQLVDLPRPEEEVHPEDADYLAEHDRVVEEETRTERFRVNPEVLSNRYAEDDKLKFEDLMDLNVTEPSTGAQVGNDRFDPDRDGRLASLPSPFTLSNKEGLQRPVPAATTSSDLAGAPNNDLLNEELGTAVNLNTKEFLFANYLNRIRRLVNFYWNQNLDNLPSSVRFSRSRYETVVVAVLDGVGSLESIELLQPSGSDPLDNAVLSAFRIAGPYPNPPEQLIEKDGRVYLPNMGFTVELGHARAAYMGVDPRQGVRYPGILKATH